jgi:hypothetical protein
LTQQNRTQCEQRALLQTFDWHLPTPFKDVFEQAVERLNS